MPVINFNGHTDLIRTFKQRYTLRADRKNPIKPGDKLYLYTGMRTKGAENLLKGVKNPLISTDKNGSAYVICKSVNNVIINNNFVVYIDGLK